MAPRRPNFDLQGFLNKPGVGTKLRLLEKGQRIFSQHDKSDSIFYVQSGRIKLSVLSNNSKEAVVAILSAGDFVGEDCVGGQLVRLATAIALGPSSVLEIKRGVAIRLLHDEVTFSERFLAHMLKRNMRFEADLVDQLFNSSEKRLARTLLLLAQYGKEGQPEEIVAHVSQETLAEMVGTTRSRVSYFMNKFRKAGFIDYNGGIRVNRSLLKVVLHD
jgi:CRP/FNR family transcriptional regulator, cyclic AMP receptor protein